MECQLHVCQAYRLSLSLKKSFIFPKRFEFIGNDVSPDGNRPAQTKHQLLESWPHPTIVRDIAKFISFVQFYSLFIHHFELCIAPLCEITIRSEYTDPVGPFSSSFTPISPPEDLASSLANQGRTKVLKPQWLHISLAPILLL